MDMEEFAQNLRFMTIEKASKVVSFDFKEYKRSNYGLDCNDSISVEYQEPKFSSNTIHFWNKIPFIGKLVARWLSGKTKSWVETNVYPCRYENGGYYHSESFKRRIRELETIVRHKNKKKCEDFQFTEPVVKYNV